MTLDQFWDIVDQVHRDCNSDFQTKCQLLEEALGKLPLAEVHSFQEHASNCLGRAYTYKMWAAAEIITGFHSDDGFTDFLGNLVSMGSETFERALVDPDTLADVADDDNMLLEDYLFVPANVLEARGEPMWAETPIELRSTRPSGQPVL